MVILEVRKRENAGVFECDECGKHEDNRSNFYSVRFLNRFGVILCSECFSSLSVQIWDVDVDDKLSEVVIPTGMAKMPLTCASCTYDKCRLPYVGTRLMGLYKLKRHEKCQLKEK